MTPTVRCANPDCARLTRTPTASGTCTTACAETWFDTTHP